MKKILTLFFALALVLGVNAAPELRTRQSMAQLKTEKPVIDRAPKARLQRDAVKPLIKKAPAAAMDADLTANYCEAAYYGATSGDWGFFFAQHVGTSYAEVMNLDVYVNDGTHIVGDYSVADGDFDLDYTEVVTPDGDTVAVVDGTLSITVVSAGVTPGQYIYHFEAELTCSDENIYTLNEDLEVVAYDFETYYLGYIEGYCYYGLYCDPDILLQDIPFVPTGDTINFVLAEPETDLGSRYADVYGYSADSSFYAYVSILTPGLQEGVYTLADGDLDPDYLEVVVNASSDEDYFRLKVLDATASVVAVDGAYNIAADMLCVDGVVYHVTATVGGGAPTGDTLTMVVPGWTMLEWSDQYQDFYGYVAYGEIQAQFDFFPTVAADPVGVYTTEDFDFDYTSVMVGMTPYDATAANLTVVNSNDTIVMDLFLTVSNGVVYHFLMQNYTIVPTDTILVEFDEVTIDEETYAAYGMTAFEASGEDYALGLGLYLDGAGHYTKEDMDAGSAFMDAATYNELYIISAEIDVQVDADGNYSMHCVLVCEDEKAYEFNIGFATGVRNVERVAKAVKTIENGHLVIEREGKRFNAQGARL